MNEDQLWLIVCGIAGVVFHCLMKLKSLLTDAQKANMDFNWITDYVKKDAVSIMLSVLSVGIWYLIFGEIAEKYKSIEDFARVSFVAMGGIGSYVIQYGLSGAKKKFRQVVDQKTNELDELKKE